MLLLNDYKEKPVHVGAIPGSFCYCKKDTFIWLVVTYLLHVSGSLEFFFNKRASCPLVIHFVNETTNITMIKTVVTNNDIVQNLS